MYRIASGETAYNMASEFGNTANKFRVQYPKTAMIYDSLEKFYKDRALEERKDSESYN